MSKNSNPRFSGFLKPSNSPVIPPVPVAEPVAPPVPKAPAAPTIKPGQVCETRRTAAQEEQSLAAKAFGLALDESEQWYATGTKMLDMGNDVFKEKRREHDDLPKVGEASDALIARIAQEQREDHVLSFRDYRIDTRGLLRQFQGGEFTDRGEILNLSDTALRQLGNRSVFTLAKLPGEEKGRKVKAPNPANFNSWAGMSKGKGMFRTRNPNDGQRQAYAVMGPRYGAFDMDQIAEVCKTMFHGDARMSVAYDGARGQIEIGVAAPFKVDETGVGSLHRVATVIKSADDGTSAIRVEYKVVRVQCINCTLLADSRLMFTRRHSGKVSDIQATLGTALNSADDAMDNFRERWADSAHKVYQDAKDGKLSVEETFKRLIACKAINLPYVADKVMYEALMEAYNAEPAKGAMGINMAITRAAHESAHQWRSPWHTDELETQAGQLLYSNRVNLPKPSDAQRARFE